MPYCLIIFKSIKKGAFCLIKGNILNSIGIAYLRCIFNPKDVVLFQKQSKKHIENNFRKALLAKIIFAQYSF
jgi:hypothetical protein